MHIIKIVSHEASIAIPATVIIESVLIFIVYFTQYICKALVAMTLFLKMDMGHFLLELQSGSKERSHYCDYVYSHNIYILPLSQSQKLSHIVEIPYKPKPD